MENIHFILYISGFAEKQNKTWNPKQIYKKNFLAWNLSAHPAVFQKGK